MTNLKILPGPQSSYLSIVEKLLDGYAVYVYTPSSRRDDHEYVKRQIERRLQEEGRYRPVAYRSHLPNRSETVVLYFFADCNRKLLILLQKD